MAFVGSILLIGGAVGLASLMAALTVRPGFISRGLTVRLMVALFALAAAGLFVMMFSSGGRSLHTGG